MPDSPLFSDDGYRSIIGAARKGGYSLTPMKDALSAPRPAMIMRHDVDVSVELALAMARLEHEAGVRSTYFFMTTCEYYNIFNEASRAALHDITGMGHEIGLHWDSRFLPGEAEKQEAFFKAQLLLLSSAAGVEIVSASQHIPTDTPAFDISPHIRFNAYAPQFTKDFSYVSDSSMVWRDKTPLDLIGDGANIQFLSHPLWWMASGRTQDEKYRAALSAAQDRLAAQGQGFLAYMHKVLEQRQFYDDKFASAAAGRKG